MDRALLEVGRCYFISFAEGGPDRQYVGRGRLVSKDPPHYAEGVLEFELLDVVKVHESWQRGYFDADDVRHEVLYDFDRWLDAVLHAGYVLTFTRAAPTTVAVLVTQTGKDLQEVMHTASTATALISELLQKYPCPSSLPTSNPA